MLGPQFRQYSAAEVEAMTPDEALDVRTQTAHVQRSGPEQRMLDLQRTARGGVLSSTAEHVGDLPHRMNEAMPTYELMNNTMHKVNTYQGHLAQPYGFGREHEENMVSNKVSPDEVKRAGQAYADAHRQIPVYNFPTEVAVNAAVSLGEGRFDDAREHLEHLQAMQNGGVHKRERYAPGDMEGLLERPRTGTVEHKQAMVDYLRGRESQSPHITNAATAMLGGKIQ